MASLRIIHDNAADRSAITVANTASGMGAEWLLTDDKGEACRILADTGTITLTWSEYESIAAVVLPATNLSADSEIRVRVYDDAAGTVLEHDTDWQWAAPGGNMNEEGFTDRLNVNDFAWDEVITVVWLPDFFAARRVVVDLRDPNRTYLDIARVVCGGYVQPRWGAEYGASVGLIDMGSTNRMASGSLRARQGPKARQADINLAVIHADDRARIKRVLDAGITHPIFVSFLSGTASPLLEQSGYIYGYQRTPGRMTYFAPELHSMPIPIDGW